MFVLVDTRSIQVIRDAILSPHPESGIQTISLKDLGVSLEPNVLYRWYLTVVLDIDSPSRDIVSGGMIERTAEVLNISDFPTFRGDTVRFYAEQGLWYDAFASISDLIVAAPDNQILRNEVRRCCSKSDCKRWPSGTLSRCPPTKRLATAS